MRYLSSLSSSRKIPQDPASLRPIALGMESEYMFADMNMGITNTSLRPCSAILFMTAFTLSSANLLYAQNTGSPTISLRPSACLSVLLLSPDWFPCATIKMESMVLDDSSNLKRLHHHPLGRFFLRSCFTRNISLSAISKSSLKLTPPSYLTMPMLTPRWYGLSLLASSQYPCILSHTASSTLRSPSYIMTNSSPANLATMAPVFPHALFRISATSMSALSPSEWPNLSLMDLKWSMSM